MFQVSEENGEVRPRQLETPLEERIEELRHRLRIEAAVVDGAKNVMRILQNTKVHDKKALQEVSDFFLFFFLFIGFYFKTFFEIKVTTSRDHLSFLLSKFTCVIQFLD